MMFVVKWSQLLVVVLFCGVNGVVVNQYSNCGSCSITTILWPTATSCVALMTDSQVFHSNDAGATWKNIATDINHIYTWPTRPLSILFQSKDGFRISNNGGNTTTALFFDIIPALYTQVQLHPNQPGWFLFLASDKRLYFSSNAGVNIVLTSAKTYNNDKNVFWSPFIEQPYTIFGLDSTNTFGYSPDFGKTWIPLINNAIGVLLSSHFLYVGIAKDGGVDLYVSSARIDPTHTNLTKYQPTGIDIPSTTKISFLDDSTGSQFMALRRSIDNAYGFVYNSDFDGNQFVQSLQRVEEGSYTYYSFDKFNGIFGAYVANAFTTNSDLKTYISYNNGAEWDLIQAPTLDYYGNPTNCSLSNGCSLNLHGKVSYYAGLGSPFYSTPDAIGLMIASGSMGASLNEYDSQTYYTSDGGFTWTQIFPKSTIYDFGNHGGILVFSVVDTPTNVVYYSFNGGITILEFNFTDQPVWVDRDSMQFIMLAHNSSKNLIISLDFIDSKLPICGHDDYESWSLSNGNQTCFMGGKTTFYRQKQSSECFNEIPHYIISENACACDWRDYECDVGFTPTAINSTGGFECIPTESVVPFCATGYRQTPATICVGGLDLQSKECPTTSAATTSAATTSSATTSAATTSSATTSAASTTSSAASTSAATTSAATSSAATSSVATITTSAETTAATTDASTSESDTSLFPTTSSSSTSEDEIKKSGGVKKTTILIIALSVGVPSLFIAGAVVYYRRNKRLQSFIQWKIFSTDGYAKVPPLDENILDDEDML